MHKTRGFNLWLPWCSSSGSKQSGNTAQSDNVKHLTQVCELNQCVHEPTIFTMILYYQIIVEVAQLRHSISNASTI